MLRTLAYFIRGFVWTLILRAHGAKVGHGLRVERGLQFRQRPHAGITIGSNVYFGPGCIIDAPRKANLSIGSQIAFTAWNYIGLNASVTIGSNTLIGERTSIRDSDHGMALGSLFRTQDMEAAPIMIGGDVWIGCGVAILKGSTIGDSAVVGANAVVRGPVEPFAIVAGVPAKVIGSRQNLGPSGALASSAD